MMSGYGLKLLTLNPIELKMLVALQLFNGFQFPIRFLDKYRIWRGQYLPYEGDLRFLKQFFHLFSILGGQSKYQFIIFSTMERQLVCIQFVKAGYALESFGPWQALQIQYSSYFGRLADVMEVLDQAITDINHCGDF